MRPGYEGVLEIARLFHIWVPIDQVRHNNRRSKASSEHLRKERASRVRGSLKRNWLRNYANPSAGGSHIA